MQLLEMRAEAGGGAEGGEAALKPLTQVLAEAKEAKEAAFQEQWKQMKVGAPRVRMLQHSVHCRRDTFAKIQHFHSEEEPDFHLP